MQRDHHPLPSPAVVLVAAISLTLAGLFAPATVLAQANLAGQWQTLPTTMPINPIHTALLHTGQILVVAGSGNDPTQTLYQAALFDPATGNVATQAIPWDLFCNGMTSLPDGRVLVTGGTLQYDPFYGLKNTTIFDPVTAAFARVQDMAAGRWYPTNTLLGDGRTATFSGYLDTGGPNYSVEIYDVGSGWGAQSWTPFTPALYPRMHLLPNGTVFFAGPTPSSHLFSPTTQTWTVNIAQTIYGGTRTYGSSVLLPLTPQNGYRPRVMIMGGDNPATNTAEMIDLGSSSPAWHSLPSMSYPRIEMNALLLPNGKVLAVGGSAEDNVASTASLAAEIFDPSTQTWTLGASGTYPRMYHSVAILLPDGRVWMAGSNPVRGTYEPHMEIYSPPYLFTTDSSGSMVAAPRPSITGAPVRVGYGTTFQVQTPNATDIASVVLIRNGADTHAFDMDQRMVGLSFSASTGSLTVTGPPTSSIAPPGYYMMFLVNSRGVPSVATFLQVMPNPTNQPPKGTITNPSADITVRAGDPVTFAGSGTDPDGTVTGYSWVFPGGTPAASTQAVPGTVSFPTPGTYVVSLTVVDDKGENDPSPPRRTITVVSSPITATLTSPAAGAILSGTQTVSMSATGTQGSANTFTLSVDNTPVFTQTIAGTTASFAWDTTTVADGAHTLALSVKDTTGAIGMASASVTVANNTPVLQAFITNPTQGSTVSGTNWVDIWAQNAIGSSNTFTLSVGTAGTPVATQTVSGLHATLAWDTTRVNDGLQTITASVRDQGGRIATASITVNVKNGTVTPPPSTLTASFTSPAAGATVSGSQTVGMSVAGASAGSTSFKLSIDGAVALVQSTPSTTATYAWDTTRVANGAHTLALVVTDASGKTAQASLTVTVNNTTTTPPPPPPSTLGVYITSPTAGSTVSGGVWSDVWVNGAATGTNTFTLTIGTTTLATQTDPSGHVTMFWDSTKVADGAVILTATVRDSAGNTGTGTLALTVHNGTTTPPPATLTASFTSPAAGATVSGTQSVGMSVTGASGSSNTFRLALDGTVVSTQTTAATSASWSWNTTTATNASHSLTLTVTDATGKTASASLTVTVNNTTTTPPPPPPSTLGVYITSPTAGSTVSGGVWTDVWVSGAAAGTNTFTLTIGTATLVTQTDPSGHVTMFWDSTKVPNGSATLTASVRDSSGNTGTGTLNLTVQNP